MMTRQLFIGGDYQSRHLVTQKVSAKFELHPGILITSKSNNSTSVPTIATKSHVQLVIAVIDTVLCNCKLSRFKNRAKPNATIATVVCLC